VLDVHDQHCPVQLNIVMLGKGCSNRRDLPDEKHLKISVPDVADRDQQELVWLMGQQE